MLRTALPPHFVTVLVAVLTVTHASYGQTITWATGPAEGVANNAKTGTIVGSGTAEWAAGNAADLQVVAMSGGKVIYYGTPKTAVINGPAGQPAGCKFEFELKGPGGAKLPNGTYDVWAVMELGIPGQRPSYIASPLKQAKVRNGLNTETVAATITCRPTGGRGTARASGTHAIKTLARKDAKGKWGDGWTIDAIQVYLVPGGGGSVWVLGPAAITPDPGDPSKGTWSLNETPIPAAGKYKALAVIALTGHGDRKEQHVGSGWQDVEVGE